MKNHKVSLHIFRRDLRLDDNTALIAALEESEHVIPCFILEKEQLHNNEYKSDNLLEFMVNSLKELDENLRTRGGRLYIFYGDTLQLIEKLVKKQTIQAVYFNADYTPYSKTRDENIKKICQASKVECKIFHDALINPPGSILKDDGKPYTIFTPFQRKARTILVSKPVANHFHNYYTEKMDEEEGQAVLEKIAPRKNSSLLVQGGSKEATFLLNKSRVLKKYSAERNIPSIQGTTFLSAHNKFGTISIREVYWNIVLHLGAHTELISELYWRDFFSHILFHYPHVFGHSFHKKYDGITWTNDEIKFKAWCEGRTGFPIVDAGMRQLNTTGWMHNRVRMVVASFLVKDLHIDWRWGEKYFAQKLVDYDPAVNNGNWQWAASTGCDAQPYFRIFNPWKQQEKFDPYGEYIKTWIPELKSLAPKDIHNLDDNIHEDIHYPRPIVDHKKASSEAKEFYALVAKQTTH
jgi:deoxyribodipyrimidine photo-lyase